MYFLDKKQDNAFCKSMAVLLESCEVGTENSYLKILFIGLSVFNLKTKTIQIPDICNICKKPCLDRSLDNQMFYVRYDDKAHF